MSSEGTDATELAYRISNAYSKRYRAASQKFANTSV